MDNTYNISFVFMSNKIEIVYTIVCASEAEIDSAKVNKAVCQAFAEYEEQNVHPEVVIRKAVSLISGTYGYNVVFLRSDMNYLIPKK